MNVLVDYDNFETIDKNRGLAYVLERTIRAIGTTSLKGVPRIQIRLYGGWFEGNRLTRLGQKISAELPAFPKPVAVTDANGSVTVIVRAALAMAPLFAPNSAYQSTYRPRGNPGRFVIEPLPYPNCANKTSCPIASLSPFLVSERCPESTCTVKPDDIVTRAEQKLVDTMLVADLIHLAWTQTESVGVVSSDDDIWPGIHATILKGIVVHHIHTKTGRTTPQHYHKLVTANYHIGSF